MSKFLYIRTKYQHHLENFVFGGILFMNKELKIYRCLDCGYILEVLDFGKRQVITKGESFVKSVTIADAKVICCGKEMEVLTPNTTEAAGEKHLPVAEFADDKLIVKVGSVTHPMIEAHYIKWVAVVNGDSMQRISLEAGQVPEATFYVGNAIEVDVYAYCNTHGLWKTTVKK